MIKLVYCLRKRDDVSHESFYQYWLSEHGPLVKSVASAIGAIRYVQSHTTLPELNELMLKSRGCKGPTMASPRYGGKIRLRWNEVWPHSRGSRRKLN